jgi:hypothetical protein
VPWTPKCKEKVNGNKNNAYKLLFLAKIWHKLKEKFG